MAVTLEANYSKKIGLPGYSSHQFMLTLRTELADLTQIGAESQRLYGLLQAAVDDELQQPGWLPEAKPANGNGGNGGHATNGHAAPRSAEAWNCTPKQQDLILRIVDENRLDKNEIEQLAQERFGMGVKQLNKLEASGLIEELTSRYPRQRGGQARPATRSTYAIR